MPLVDTSPVRASACPVHFVWDGHGLGRPLVRVGFLGLLVSGACVSAGLVWHRLGANAVWSTTTMAVTTGAIAVWGLGQIASRITLRRASTRMR